MFPRFKFYWLFWILCVFNARIAYGQHLDFRHVKYNTENGLLSSEVYHAIKDVEGYMWFATSAGVSRFDGYTFKNYTTANGLTDNTIFRSFEDQFKRIWFLAHDGSLCYFYQDSIYPYKHNDTLQKVLKPGNWLAALSIDTVGDIQFYSRRGDYGQIKQDGSHEFYRNTSLHHHQLHINFNGFFPTFSLSEHSNRGILLSQGKDSLLYPSYDFIPLPFNITPNQFVLEGHNQIIYITADTIIKTKHKPGSVNAIALDHLNRPWVCYSDEGIMIYKSMTDFQRGHPPISQLFKHLNVSSIWMEENGETWLTIENYGVYYISNSGMTNYVFHDFDKHDAISTINRTRDGEIIYSTENNGIYKITAAGKHQLLFRNIDEVNSISIKENDQYVIATHNRDYVNKKPKQATIVHARTCLPTQQDSMWYLKDYKAFCMVKNDTVFDSEDQGLTDFFRCIFQDRTGRLWLGGNTGLYFYENSKNLLINANALSSIHKTEKVIAIKSLSDGTLIIGLLNNGLIFLNPKSSDNARRVFLNKHSINNLHVDEKDIIWVASNNGLLRIDPSNIQSIQQISSLHGLPTNEVKCVTSNKAKIYVGTHTGLAVFNKQASFTNYNPPQLHFTNLKVNEIYHSIDSNLTFNYTENYIEFNYTAISFRANGKILYKYRLDGAENQWQTTYARQVRYPKLQPGHYTFYLSAQNEDGYWSNVKQIQIHILPPIWNRVWFKIVATILVLIGLTLLYIRIRNRINDRHLKNKKIASQKRALLEMELQALRAQINPHFMFNTLNSIQNSVKQMDQVKALEYIKRFSSLLRKVLENSRKLTLSVGEEIAMLKLYIDLENKRINNQINWSINIDEAIDPSFHAIPSMVIQPFVENAIIHGLNPKTEGPKTLTIDLKMVSDTLICIIEDSGIGRVKSQEINARKQLQKKSLGLKITKERLALFFNEQGEKLNYKIIDLYDENNTATGTRVEVYFGSDLH